MERLLISACLMGFHCKYSGGSNALPPELLCRLREKYILVPVCPETAGGLGVPRLPGERRGGRVISSAGENITAPYQKGAHTALVLVRRFACKKALFKERSPSCGSGRIYDGSFSGTLTDGDGVAAELLRSVGVEVVGESAAEKLL